MRLFEFSFLAELGYGIDFISAAATSDFIELNKQYYYEPSEGFFCIDSLDENKKNSLLVSCNIFDGSIILAIKNQEYTNQCVRQSAKYISRMSLNHILMGKKIKSRDFFQ